MDNKLVLLVGITAGIAAAVYLLYQELQKQRLQIRDQNLQIRALIQQSKRVEGLIYTYNIDQLENDHRNSTRLMSSHVFPVEENARDMLVAWSEEQLGNNTHTNTNTHTHTHSNTHNTQSSKSKKRNESSSHSDDSEDDSSESSSTSDENDSQHSTQRNGNTQMSSSASRFVLPPRHTIPVNSRVSLGNHEHIFDNRSHVFTTNNHRMFSGPTRNSSNRQTINNDNNLLNQQERVSQLHNTQRQTNTSTNSMVPPQSRHIDFSNMVMGLLSGQNASVLLNGTTPLVTTLTTTISNTSSQNTNNIPSQPAQNIKTFDVEDEEEIASHSEDDEPANDNYNSSINNTDGHVVSQSNEGDEQLIETKESFNEMKITNYSELYDNGNVIEETTSYKQDNNDETDDDKSVKFYKDTFTNRKLGRVGLPIPKK